MRFLLPQVGDFRVVRELPLIELCNGLVAEALDQGFERLEVLAPRPGAVIAKIRACQGRRRSECLELPSSMHQRVVRRFKAMAKMRRTQPADTRGVIRFVSDRRKPVDIRVRLRPRADGEADVIMTLR
jgi:type II secretory ATPase GspE/PulE/Tfp pilus assembly ATPase PilB-like protein